MTIEPQLSKALEKKYSDFLVQIIQGIAFNPIVLKNRIKAPGTFKEVHLAMSQFTNHLKTEDKPGWEIKEWEALGGRNAKTLIGQVWPKEMIIPTEDDLFYFLDRRKEVTLFRKRLSVLLSWNEAIKNWLLKKPEKVLSLDRVWDELCAVVDYLLINDVAGQYIRAISVPAHTKFIKEYESDILSILCFLKPEHFNPAEGGLSDVLKLAQKPMFYPARWLDASMAQRYSAGMLMQAFVPDELRKVTWEVKYVCLVENETNLYLLPETKDMLAIFSWGKALSLLEEIPLLRNARLFYWGDLDEDGFVMLNSIRYKYNHVESILMDESTIKMHDKEKRTQNRPYEVRELKYLNAGERQAYYLLAAGSYRIEQERLQQDYVQQILNYLLPG